MNKIKLPPSQIDKVETSLIQNKFFIDIFNIIYSFKLIVELDYFRLTQSFYFHIIVSYTNLFQCTKVYIIGVKYRQIVEVFHL